MYLIYMYIGDLALNNLQWLISHKIQPNPTQPNPTNKPTTKSINLLSISDFLYRTYKEKQKSSAEKKSAYFLENLSLA